MAKAFSLSMRFIGEEDNEYRTNREVDKGLCPQMEVGFALADALRAVCPGRVIMTLAYAVELLTEDNGMREEKPGCPQYAAENAFVRASKDVLSAWKIFDQDIRRSLEEG